MPSMCSVNNYKFLYVAIYSNGIIISFFLELKNLRLSYKLYNCNIMISYYNTRVGTDRIEYNLRGETL